MLLARSLNYRSLADLCDNLDSAEFALWAAEYERNPWDERRADLRAGVIASTVANFAGKVVDKNKPPLKPLEFMPYCQPEPEELPDDPDELRAFVTRKFNDAR